MKLQQTISDKFSIVLFLAMLLLTLPTVSFAQPRGYADPSAITFNKNIFEKNLHNIVAPLTVGYQSVLIKDGVIVSEKFGGKARRGNDGNLNMTAATPINLGSLFKFISGTAMLHLMENPPSTMGLNYKQVNFDNRLGKPIWAEFPNVWLDVIPGPYEPGPQQRNIKFRQLLQHRSGFDNDWNAGQIGGRPFLPYLQNGFSASQYGVREYANMNFVTVGHLLPLLENHQLNYDLDIETSGYPQSVADSYVRNRLGQRMDELIRERIWSNMNPQINASCDAKNEMANTAAYGYSSTTDNDGVISSAIETQGYCSGEGGYYMSARDFANYVAHFSQTNLIVSQTVRDKMYNETMNPNDRMVWTSASSDSWMDEKFDMPRVAWSNGITDGTRTVLLRLPQNYYLILLSNSAAISTNQLYNYGLAAFKSGMVHNFD